MPTLEDTVEFQAITLNDLLEADAKAGVGPVGADEGKYKTWFMVSSAAAAIFAVLFVGALVTGGGGDGGGDSSVQGIEKPADLKGESVRTTLPLPPGIKPGSHVSVSKGNELLVPNALVLNYKELKEDASGVGGWEVQLGVTEADQAKLRGLRGGQIGDAVDTPASTATTASTVPAGTPAGESPTPAPATTPNS